MDNSSALTLWNLKKVLRDRQPRPIWPKIVNTFEAEPPASKIARQRRKLPAGNFVPGMKDWLCHVLFGLGYLELLQLLVTTASVPTCWTSTIGLSALQLWQKPKSNSNCDKEYYVFGLCTQICAFHWDPVKNNLRDFWPHFVMAWSQEHFE